MCLECQAEVADDRNVWIALVHLGVIGSGAYVLVTGTPGLFAYLLFAAAFIDTVAIVTTIVHEAAHALTAWTLRLPVQEISIGLGPRLARFHIGRLRVVIRLLPMSGHVGYVPRARATRVRSLLTTAAGPLSHLPLALWVASLDPSDPAWVPLQGVAVQFILLVAVINLIPHRGTDGRRLVDLIRMSDEEVDGFASLGDVLEEMAPFMEHQGPASATHGQREALLRHLAKPAIEPGARAMSLNNLAVVDLFLRDPDLLDEADDGSREAMDLLPDSAAVRNTRGAVLIETGEYEAGIELMEPTMHRVPVQARGSSYCELAYAHAALGNAFMARRHLTSAITSGFSAPPFEEALLLLGSLEVGIVRAYLTQGSAEDALAALRRDAGREATTTGLALCAHIDSTGEDADLEAFGKALAE